MDISSGGTCRFVSTGTTASAANAFLNSVDSNLLQRSTSSIRYKNVIADLTVDEAKNLILGSVGKRYYSKIEEDGNREFVGFLAEEIEKLDPRFVTYDDEGRVDWVQYPALVVPLAEVLKEHEARITAIEAALDSLITAP